MWRYSRSSPGSIHRLIDAESEVMRCVSIYSFLFGRTSLPFTFLRTHACMHALFVIHIQERGGCGAHLIQLIETSYSSLSLLIQTFLPFNLPTMYLLFPLLSVSLLSFFFSLFFSAGSEAGGSSSSDICLRFAWLRY